MKIFHSGDVHLGRKRMQGRLPDEDMAQAFSYIVNQAILEKANVFLITGDFFDSPIIEPHHLKQAIESLTSLKNAGIRAIAIEGNHDRSFLQSFSDSWLYYLKELGFIHLLHLQHNPFIDIQGVRFVGCGYQGSLTSAKIQSLMPQLKEWRQTHPIVLLAHAGPIFYFGEAGGLTENDLKELKKNVSYLALGHLHKPLLIGNWCCNPGSIENCRLSESLYDAASQRGYAVIELTTNEQKEHSKEHSKETLQENTVKIALHSNPRREITHERLDCTPFGSSLKGAVDKLEEAALALLSPLPLTPETVVSLELYGICHADRLRFDVEALELKLQEKLKIYALFLNLEKLKLYTGRKKQVVQDIKLSKGEIEQQVFAALIEDYFGYQEKEVLGQELLALLNAVENCLETEANVENVILANPLVDFLS